MVSFMRKPERRKNSVCSTVFFLRFADLPEQVGCGRVYLHVIEEKERRSRRFQTLGREFTIQISSPPENVDALDWLEKAVHALYNLIIGDHEQEDNIELTISLNDFKDGAVWLSFRPIRDLNPEDLWLLIECVVQSNSDFIIDQTLVVVVAFVKVPVGSGKRRALTHEDVRKRSILQIKKGQNDCLPRSLVTALAYIMKGDQTAGEYHEYWTKVRRCNGKKQTLEANLLNERAGVRIPEAGCGKIEIEKYQAYFRRFNVAIVVYLFQTFALGGETFYDGEEELEKLGIPAEKTLRIMFFEESRHYRPILNVVGASGFERYCVDCNRGYACAWHRCSKKCEK